MLGKRGRPAGKKNMFPRKAREGGRHLPKVKMYQDFLKEDKKEMRYAKYGVNNESL